MASAVLRAEHDQLDWVAVESTNLKRVAYHGVGALWVQFHRDPDRPSKYDTYRYEHVPRRVYDALLAAPSKGGYHARHIKGVYAYLPVF